MRKIYFILLLIASNVQAETLPAITASIPTTNINNYQNYPPIVKKIIKDSLQLANKNLTYSYGSADPSHKGMDCSGTIYYLLNHLNNADAPRQADEMFNWVSKQGILHRVSNQYLNSNDFRALKPGDLLFWSGTYHTSRSISHVMLYLGKNTDDKPIMFGSSDGRTYQGKRMRGVSVFDFVLPKSSDKAVFVGYSCVPKLTC